jgi:hypothetical protein
MSQHNGRVVDVDIKVDYFISNKLCYSVYLVESAVNVIEGAAGRAGT